MILGFILAILLHGKGSIGQIEETIKPDEKATIGVRSDSIKITRKSSEGIKSVSQTFVPESAKVEIIHKETGEIKINVQKLGVAFNPGIGFAFSQDRLVPVFDARLVYYDRFSLFAGGTLRHKPLFYGALGYNFYGRTSVFLGKANRGYIAGIRVSF